MEKTKAKNKEIGSKKATSSNTKAKSPASVKAKASTSPKSTTKKQVKQPQKKANKSNDTFIQLKNLTKFYINSKSEIVTALKDVSFTLPSTGFVYLKGESGSGKSTLLNILGGLDSYDKGDMVVGRLSFKDLSFKDLDNWRAHHTAFVFQDFNLLSDFTVAENIRLGSNFAGMDITDEQVSDVLSKVGLKGFENRTIGQLSGGERQRVSIARALVKTPRILLVDEPTGQINVENAEKVFSILKDISKEVLVICVSYDPSVKKYVDREITLSKGEVIKDTEIKRSKEEKITVQDSGLRNITKKQNYVEATPSNHIFRIGLRNITGKRKWRTLVLVLLTTFSLLFGSVLYMLSGYNQYEALAKNLQLEKTSYLFFEVDDPIDMYTDTIYHNRYLKLTPPKELKINSILEMVAPQNNQPGGYNAFGQKLLYGKYPTSEEKENEPINYRMVVITDYLASRIVDLNGKLIKEEDYESKLINKTIKFNEYDIPQLVDITLGDFTLDGCLTIAGIIETDYQQMEASNPKQYEFNVNNIYKTIHTASNFHEGYVRLASYNEVDINNVSFTNVEFYAFKTFLQNNPGNFKFTDGEEINADTTIAEGAVMISKGMLEKLDAELNEELNAYDIKTGFLEKEYSINRELRIIDSYENIIVFNEDDFTSDVAQLVLFPPSGVVLSLNDYKDKSVAELSEMFEMFDKAYGARLLSASSDEIHDFSEKMNLFKSAILISTIVSIVLTMALFYNFISLVIVDNKKNIGVLRSLGASAGNIASIFFITISMIAIACTLLTSILSMAVAAIINSAVLNSLSIPFHIIIFDPALIGVILLICTFIGVMATATPIIRYSKRSPISQIKGNRIFRLKDADKKLRKIALS